MLQTIFQPIYSIKWAANQASLVSLYSSFILSTSLFIYITIYSTYVPTVKITRPVYLQFDSNCQENCSNPYAVVLFHDYKSLHLSRGQSYKFVLELEMPESNVNWNQGMFMARMKLLNTQGKTLTDISRPGILKYKSRLTKLINAMVKFPFLIANMSNEKQIINIQLVDNFLDGPKLDRAIVEILGQIQVYSAQLHIIANLSGLNYYMYHWAITSAIIGSSTIAMFLAILSIYRNHSSSDYKQSIEELDYPDNDDQEDENMVDSSSGLIGKAEED